MDLQEATRRDDVLAELTLINEKVSALPVFPALVWVWTHDVLKNIYDNNTGPNQEDEAVPSGVTFKDVWDKFWTDVDTLGINMDLGGEVIEETLMDWMRENDFLVALDDDGWLDDEEEEDEDE